MLRKVEINPPRERADVVRFFDGVIRSERAMEFLHDARAKEQFKEIEELSHLAEEIEILPIELQVPRLRGWTRNFSHHCYWLEDSSDEMACHHSRWIRIFGEVLSWKGFFSKEYKDFALLRLNERLEKSADPEGGFMTNIRERIKVISDLRTFDVELPHWLAPKQAVANLRRVREDGVFKSQEEIFSALEKARSR